MTAHPIKWGAPTVGSVTIFKSRAGILATRERTREREGIFEFRGWIGDDFS
jgi:hypothetical protein